MAAPEVDLVVPTRGRASLTGLLAALAAARGPRPGTVLLVDDRRRRHGPLAVAAARNLVVDVVVAGGRGPAAARNAGWRASRAEWIAFLDDDVIPRADWFQRLAEDLTGLDDRVAASQGRVAVPLAAGRRPTDWERHVKSLETGRWITADIAYRRRALAELGGFDDRFPRAYREDVDLALRAMAAGYEIVDGRREVVHPVPPATSWVSLGKQAGNADDALMLARHGPGWRRLAGPPGRLLRHIAVSGAGLLAVGAALVGHRRLASLMGAAWLAGILELAAARILPGPRTAAEVVTMLATSAGIPALATFHWLRGLAVHWRPWRRLPAAVLFDRDGTLVEDVPHNGDPALVRPRPGARSALDRLRRLGIPIGVVTNQSGVGRGLLTADQVDRVNRRVEEMLGPFGAWAVCPHGPGDDCACRKPGPGLILAAAAGLGVAPERCAVIGDIGSDLEAARAVGARGILVPTPVTRGDEIAAASEVATDLEAAVSRLVGAGRR